MTDNIRDWIRKNPETNRRKLCKRFEDDNGFAYKFAEEHPEYQDFIKYFITESKYAYLWALHIGNEEFMKYRVTHPEYAIWWASYIGDEDFMKQIVEDDGEYIDAWNDEFEDNQI